MSELLPGLLVLEVGGSVAPPLLLLTILFLGSRRHLPNAGALALGSLRTWIGKHNRTITVAICFVFGAFFLTRGLLGA